MPVVMDTHMHSTASDGIWTPEQLVIEAKKSGLETIALTDHDNIYGLDRALEEANKKNLNFINGIEVDARGCYGPLVIKEIEIIGLNFDITRIQNFAQRLMKNRLNTIQQYIHNFNDYILSTSFQLINDNLNHTSLKANDYNNILDFSLEKTERISLDSLIAWKKQKSNDNYPLPFLSRIDLINYIYDCFGKKSAKEFIKKDYDIGNKLKKDYKFLWQLEVKAKKPLFQNAIKEIKSAKGVAIIAHPGIKDAYESSGMIDEWNYPENNWYKRKDGFTPFDLIKDLKARGLDGIEIYPYFHNGKSKSLQEQNIINKYFSQMAKLLDLIVTYGSDCHGPRLDQEIILGKFGAEENYTHLLKRK